MIVHEKEASKKWCPMGRTEQSVFTNGNEIKVIGNDFSSCKGPGCMMWREAIDRKGFCGLAGVPINLRGLFKDGDV